MNSKDWCDVTAQGLRLSVQITPNAKKSEVIGVLAGILKIRLQAQPIEGKANEALVRYLADKLDIPKSAIVIARGHTNKRKIIELNVPGLTIDRVKAVLRAV